MRLSLLRTSAGLAAAIALTLCAVDAQAGWNHRHGGSAGSHGGSYGGSDGGSYGSAGSGSGGGSYGSAGGSASDCGSHGGGHRHGWRARKHGSAGGSTGGSYGSTGGSSGGSYGGSHGSAGGTPSYTPEQAAKAEVPKDGVLLTVTVPAEAQLTINGKPTSSLGATRVFAAKGLQAGKKYDFVVKMQTSRNGQPISEEKKVSLAVGDRQQIALAGEPAQAPKAALAAVPAGAAKQ